MATVTWAPDAGWVPIFTVPLAHKTCSGLQEGGSSAMSTSSGPPGDPTVIVLEAWLLAVLVSAVQLTLMYIVYVVGNVAGQSNDAVPLSFAFIRGISFWL